MSGRFKFIIFSPWFHSLVISIFIFFLLPDIFSKYECDEVNSEEISGIKKQIHFNDLDYDGCSEEIHSFFSTDSMHAIHIFNHEGGLTDQWNMRGEIPDPDHRIFFADINHDHVKEVFAFAYNFDSLLISCFNPFKKNEYLVHNRFILQIERSKGKTDLEISDITSHDINKDNQDELIFTLNKRNTFNPRKIIIYDVINDTAWSSASTGFAMNKLTITDLNSDGYCEITGNNCASGNKDNRDSTDYSDYSAWLALYDHNLQFVFPPCEFKGFHSTIITVPVSSDGINLLAAFYFHTGTDGYKPLLSMYNYSGNLVKTVDFPDTVVCEKYFFAWPGDKIIYYVADENGSIYRLDDQFKFTKVNELGYAIHPMPEICADLDSDGRKEMIFVKKNNREGVIFREGFTDPVKFSLPVNSKNYFPWSVHTVEMKGAKTELFIQKGNVWQRYAYGFNPKWYLRYPVYPVIYFAVVGLVFLIRFLQRLQMRERTRLQSDIAQLQMKAINQQIDPHFTFNAFNSIALLLKKEKGEKAYDYFMRFTDLIRISLLTSDQIFRSAEEELIVVKNYLELQKLRLQNRFNYNIDIAEDVNLKILVPKMVIQTFTENAVKHGFRNITSGGLLKIEIRQNDGILSLRIEDNGIGRKKAAETKSESTGIGLSVMDRYLMLLNKYNGLQIEKEIIDLYNEQHEPAGTRVIIKIPVEVTKK